MSFQPVIKMINAGPKIIDACNQFIYIPSFIVYMLLASNI